MIRLSRLYAVADATFGDPVEIARELFEGGVRLVQIRHKSASAKTLLDETEAILRLMPLDAQLVVNESCRRRTYRGSCGRSSRAEGSRALTRQGNTGRRSGDWLFDT
jgi:hypothetical protein